MEQDHPWLRGRLGWSTEALGPSLRDSREPSPPRRLHHSGPPLHKFKPNRPAWDDTVHDLASMRLTPAELARKLASRQSSNIALARAQLLEQSRKPGSHSPNLPPALAARLKAARQQSVDSILAQSNAALIASQRIREAEARETRKSTSQERKIEPDGKEDIQGGGDEVKSQSTSRRNTPVRELVEGASTDTDQVRVKSDKVTPPKKEERADDSTKHPKGKGPPHRTSRQKMAALASAKEARKLLDSSQGAATRTSLDHTITMVVNTCRELWQQLEEERLTRERLQQQLHHQGNVITTLTTELLQIQDQQEAILREVSDARASGLWGIEGDLSGGSSGSTDGDDLASGHPVTGRIHSSRSSHQSLSSRHPQRSILRATRTIHPTHLRQTPSYQTLPHSPRVHHTSPMPPHQPPHSPRPHQPVSRSLQSSPTQPNFPLSLQEVYGHGAYKNSISRKIRDALVSGQCPSQLATGVSAGSAAAQLGLTRQPPEGLPKNSLEKEKIAFDKQLVPATATANKENTMETLMDDNVMDSTVTEMMQKK